MQRRYILCSLSILISVVTLYLNYELHYLYYNYLSRYVPTHFQIVTLLLLNVSYLLTHFQIALHFQICIPTYWFKYRLKCQPAHLGRYLILIVNFLHNFSSTIILSTISCAFSQSYLSSSWSSLLPQSIALPFPPLPRLLNLSLQWLRNLLTLTKLNLLTDTVHTLTPTAPILTTAARTATTTATLATTLPTTHCPTTLQHTAHHTIPSPHTAHTLTIIKIISCS